jgi:acyl carrier protein
MNDKNVSENIIKMFKDQLGQRGGKFDPTVPFMAAGVDSVEFVKILMRIEDEYGFEFTDEELSLHHFKSIGDIIDYIEKNS